jgi:hypothetical protein
LSHPIEGEDLSFAALEAFFESRNLGGGEQVFFHRKSLSVYKYIYLYWHAQLYSFLCRFWSASLSQSPQGNWRWTRKLKAKTVTVALSDKQAELFRLAIDGHRELENLIRQMRAISQQVLLDSVEGPPRRKRRISS